MNHICIFKFSSSHINKTNKEKQVKLRLIIYFIKPNVVKHLKMVSLKYFFFLPNLQNLVYIDSPPKS